MDYAFEDHTLGAVHRIGFGFGFGSTVDDSRLAARKAEQDAVEARLNDAFQKRQEDQVATLLTRADDLRAAGSFEEAAQLLSTAAVIDPERADLTARLGVCLRERGSQLESSGDLAQAQLAFGRALAVNPADSLALAGEQRCQAASDSKAARSSDLREQFRVAMEAFASDDVVKARRGFQSILAVEPADTEAVIMLRRTEQAADRRVRTLLEQADAQIREGRLDAADESIDGARAIAPGSSRIASSAAALARARTRSPESARPVVAPTPSAPATAARSALTLRERREIADLYRRGLQAMKERRTDDAIRYWELVWSKDPGHENVAEFLKREYLARGMEAFARGRLDEAVSLWERAVRVDPKDARARGYLARAQKQMERTREILGGSP
jgi:tetratricopeptide (TPR) repeat protein